MTTKKQDFVLPTSGNQLFGHDTELLRLYQQTKRTHVKLIIEQKISAKNSPNENVSRISTRPNHPSNSLRWCSGLHDQHDERQSMC